MRAHAAALALAVFVSPHAVASAADNGAAGMIQSFYGHYKDSMTDKTPDIMAEKYYCRRVRGLLRTLKASCKRKGKEICGPNYDFFVDGQDYKLSDFSTRTVSDSDGKARVETTFRNMGKPMQITFDMVQENGRWLIDQMTKAGRDGYTLDTLFKPGASP